MVWHLIPAAEADEHQTTDDCPCGIQLELVAGDNGTVGWDYIHQPMRNTMQKPSPARMVMALVDPSQNNGSDTAPAVITRVWGEHPAGGWMVNVRVLFDAFTTPLWLTSIRLVDDEATARTAGSPAVFWPPRI